MRNSNEIIARLNHTGRIHNDEILVSFGVRVLFPSVPIVEVLYLFEDWITTQENSTKWRKKTNLYRKLAFICTSESYSTFRNVFYKTISETAMG